MLRIQRWMALSFLIFIGGCTDVQRPDTNICLNNVKLLETECFNLKSDYDKDGNLKKDAHPVVTYYQNSQAMLSQLDKSFGTDPIGWANLKAYIQELRAANK